MKPLFSTEMLLRGEVTPQMARKAGSTMPKLSKPLPYGVSSTARKSPNRGGNGHK